MVEAPGLASAGSPREPHVDPGLSHGCDGDVCEADPLVKRLPGRDRGLHRLR